MLAKRSRFVEQAQIRGIADRLGAAMASTMNLPCELIGFAGSADATSGSAKSLQDRPESPPPLSSLHALRPYRAIVSARQPLAEQ